MGARVADFGVGRIRDPEIEKRPRCFGYGERRQNPSGSAEYSSRKKMEQGCSRTEFYETGSSEPVRRGGKSFSRRLAGNGDTIFVGRRRFRKGDGRQRLDAFCDFAGGIFAYGTG